MSSPMPEFTAPDADFSSAPTATQPSLAPPSYPAYGPAQVFPARGPKRRAGVAGLLAVALLAGGVGGGVGIAADRYFADSTPTASNATRIVQADATSPDWIATAAAVSDAVVAIQVSAPGASGEGSGVILDATGTIVTNNHVVSGAGARAQITVVVGNRNLEATVVGTDPSTDLAVIRLVDPPSDLTTASWGDSSALEVGEPVMAVGNPLGLSDTVTTGIVSALDRPVTTRAVSSTVGDTGNGTVVTAAIQTSAAINPGNSGGALVNAAGELVGITSSIATLTSNAGTQSGNIGIGFAIPATQAKNVVEQLVATGSAQHAQLGLNAQDPTDASLLGAEVAEVVPGSAAAEAGLRAGDVITALDGRAVASSESLVALIRSSAVGQLVQLTVLRDGETEQLNATLKAAA